MLREPLHMMFSFLEGGGVRTVLHGRSPGFETNCSSTVGRAPLGGIGTERYVKDRPVEHDRPSMSTVRYSVGGIGSFSSVTGIQGGRRGRVRAGHGSAAPVQTELPSGP